MKINKNFKVSVVGAILVLTLGSIVGCTTKKEESPNNSNQTNQNQEASFKNIDGAKAEEIMKDAKDLLILDVRNDKEYNEGHIENAVNIPVTELEKRLGELDKDKTILVYCNVGRKSAEASSILQKDGFSKVYNSIDGVKEFDFTLVK